MNNVDRDGFPGTQGESGEFDGGDTAAILGGMIALSKFGQLESYTPLRLVQLQSRLFKHGAPIRHPDSLKWYGCNDRFSRDQLVATLCGLVVVPNQVFCALLFAAHKSRWFLTAWNTRKNGVMGAPKKFPDITLFEVWGLWIRIMRPWWRHLVLWFFDIETLIGAIHWRLFRKDRVTRNHMLVMLTCMNHSPTPALWLAYRITDWPEMVLRWKDHCTAVREYDTAGLFLCAAFPKMYGRNAK